MGLKWRIDGYNPSHESLDIRKSERLLSLEAVKNMKEPYPIIVLSDGNGDTKETQSTKATQNAQICPDVSDDSLLSYIRFTKSIWYDRISIHLYFQCQKWW